MLECALCCLVLFGQQETSASLSSNFKNSICQNYLIQLNALIRLCIICNEYTNIHSFFADAMEYSSTMQNENSTIWICDECNIFRWMWVEVKKMEIQQGANNKAKSVSSRKPVTRRVCTKFFCSALFSVLFSLALRMNARAVFFPFRIAEISIIIVL